jgi:copper resistance protein C
MVSPPEPVRLPSTLPVGGRTRSVRGAPVILSEILMRSCLSLTRRALGAALLVAVLGTLSVSTAQPVAAHAIFVGSDPQPGGQIDHMPERISIRVARKEATPAGDPIVVLGPMGNRVDLGDVRVDDDGTVVSVGLRADVTEPGEYHVYYQLMSADTHVISDHLRFTVTEPAPAATGSPVQLAGASRAPTPNPTRLRAMGPPVASIVAAIVLLAAAGLVTSVGMRRRRRAAAPLVRVVRTGEHRMGPIPTARPGRAPYGVPAPARDGARTVASGGVGEWRPGGTRGSQARSVS